MALAGSLISLGVLICIYGILSLGLNLKFGYNGLLDIGHVAFYLIGAYGAALLVLPPSSAPTQQYATYILGLGWTWPPAIAAAMLVAGVAGMLVALPAIRLREDYLAIAVLGISVVAKRVVQSESWLANGPTSLKGWSAPLTGAFPMPGGDPAVEVVLFGVGFVNVTLFSLPTALVFGAVVFVVWSIVSYGVASVATPATGERSAVVADGGRPGRLRSTALAVSTLGLGYAAGSRAATRDGPPALRPALAGGAVAGVVATALALVGDRFELALGVATLDFFQLAVGVFLGFASFASWVLAALFAERHYAGLPRRDALAGLGMAVALVVLLSPLILLGGGGADTALGVAVIGLVGVGIVAGVVRLAALSTREVGVGVGLGLAAGVAAAPATAVGGTAVWAGALALLAAVGYGTTRLRGQWAAYGDGGRFTAVAGVTVGTGLLAVFLPAVLLGGGPEFLASTGLLATLVLAVAYVAGLYHLGANWDRVGAGGSFVQTVGFATVSLFLLRYFLLTLVQPLKTGGVGAAANSLLRNLVWLVNVTPAGPALNYRRFFFLLVVGVLALAYVATERTVKSPFGRVLKAIREDEDVATALGKNTFRFKVQSMIIGSALAGLAGALAAIYFGALVHTMFAPRITFVALLMVVIGGTANNKGALLGAVVFWGFQTATQDLAAFFPTEIRAKIQALRLAFIGALFMLILYYRPEGIWGEERTTMEDVE
jgi:ABC-type branched-subunit amino acid transport system permease subunit